MGNTRSILRSSTTTIVALPIAGLLLSALPLRADLLWNLQAFPALVKVGDPGVMAADEKEGPKGITGADFNGDGKPDLAVSNLDGTITVLIAQGGGFFLPARHLNTSAKELRGVLAADLNTDGKPDIAAASPEDGQLMVYFNTGGGNFGPKMLLPGWTGVRSLAAGDFDGDGLMDLAAAGPGMGVRHLRGTGGGAFEIMGDNVRLSPKNVDLSHPRPVYALRVIRSRDGLRDDLLVTHADSPALYVMSTVLPDRTSEPPLLARVPAWQAPDPPVVINEVQVLNRKTLRDADGTTQPWVELLNRSTAPVTLSGWRLKLQNMEWPLPNVTLDPGRFRVIFLSGKNRGTGPEWHASFLLKQNTGALNLLQPNGVEANRVELPKHVVTDVSRGLAPDNGAEKWFDIPSPGAENNAGIVAESDLPGESSSTTVIITPPSPGPGQSVTIKVLTPERPTGSSSVRTVWFSATPGLTEKHHQLYRLSPGVFGIVLPPGEFRSGIPNRVLAQRRDDGTTNVYTVEIYRSSGTTDGAASVPVRPGCLLPVASLPSPKVKSFESGPILSAVNQPGAQPDLVFADDWPGLLRVHRAAPDARRFEPVPAQSLPVTGLPRDVKLADMDADGWLDALVVLQEVNAVVICRNSGGILNSPSGSLETGDSPREALIADFTGDGRPDAAVINRESENVSILASGNTATGLVSRDQNYPTDGDVAALAVKDFNGDGHADVLQLHRASSEISIRLANADGRLGAPVFYPVAAQGASAMAVADVNNDGKDDVVTANLGFGTDGSISVIKGAGDGSFGVPQTISAGASLFAIAVADFNSDGNQDVIAGLWDCTAAFFFGDGQGVFAAAYELPVPFVIESRVMVTEDFDQDGDIDIAGAGIEGDMVTLENTGAATGASWLRRYYPSPGQQYYGANRIGLTTLNDDADPDLIVGTGYGVLLFRGLPGTGFFPVPPEQAGNPSTGVPYPISDVFTADIDGDGALDMVAACRAAACLDLLTQGADGKFVRSLQVDVPSSRFLGTGDLDGDGLPDLVGTGDVLWTVLSSHPPLIAAPNPSQNTRPQSTAVVINEVLGRNTSVSVPADRNRNSDYVEIFNGGSVPTALTGWKLRVQSTQEGAAIDETWTLPSLTVSARGRIVIVFAEIDPLALPGTSPRTGFVLPAEGGIVTLLKPDGSTADRVDYPRAQENVSWSRFLDGHPAFHADPVPSPGLSNSDNGRPPPEVELTPPSPAALKAYQPIKFTARGRDDLGIITMSLIWNRLDDPMPAPQRLNLYDDGRHGDGPAVDGIFAGTMPGLPPGAEVQFYLEAEDISGEVLRLPEVAELSAPGQPPVAWSFTIGDAPALEISETCNSNSTLLRDERGGHPDYVNVRNTGSVPVDLSRILLAKSPLSDSIGVYSFPSGLTLPAGGEITVFADAQPSEGPLHAPFSLDAEGDDLSLLAVMPSGARQWIHSLKVPPSAADLRFMPLPGTNLRALVARNTNPDAWSGILRDDSGNAFAAVRFFAPSGETCVVEGDAPGSPAAWSAVATISGDNAMHVVTRPLTEMATLRAVIPSQFAVLVDTVIPGIALNTGPGAAVCGRVAGTLAGPFEVSLYYSLNPDLSAPEVVSLPLSGNSFQFPLVGLLTDTAYHYRVGMNGSGGDFWSAPGATFRTPAAGTSLVALLQHAAFGSTTAGISVALSAALPAGANLRILMGTRDGLDVLTEWPRDIAAAESGSSWTGNFTGLVPGTDYFVRAAMITPEKTSVSLQCLRLRTSNANNSPPGHLRISEIMYSPYAPNAAETAAGYLTEDFEFVELHNDSPVSIDLSGMWFAGMDFDFPPSGAPVIPPGGYAVIANNPHAFAMRYGADVPLVGWVLHPFRSSKLSNGRQDLALHRADGSRVVWVHYDDSLLLTDGGGRSLESPDGGTQFAASMAAGGSPGVPALKPLIYSQWSALTFSGEDSNNPAVSGPSADPDNDGSNNFAEYTLGSDPGRAGSKDILSIRSGGVSGSGGTMILTFPVNPAAIGASCTLQILTDVWSDVATYRTGSGLTSPYPAVLVNSGAPYMAGGRVMMAITVPLQQMPGGFLPRRQFRLKIAP